MSGIPESLATLAVPIDSLEPYPGNARRGDLDTIKNSLRVNGQYRPVVVNRRNGQVLAGNHTVQAARALGWTEVAATFVDASDEEARRIVLIDNRANDIAGYDDEALAELLGSLEGDFDGTGYDAAALDDLLAGLGGGYSIEKKDAVPPLPTDPVTQLGDVITLGDHRLVCGDSLKLDVCRAALLGEHVDLVVTDPPYGINYGFVKDDEETMLRRKRQDDKMVANDALSADEMDVFIDTALDNLAAVLKRGGSFYIFAPPGADETRTRVALLKSDTLMLKQALIWVKDRFSFCRQDYHYRHEPFFYGWKSGKGHYFIDDATQDTVWEFDKPSRSKEHPTMKPVAILERMIENSSRKGEVVFDPFGGSGSTLIAAEATGRRACLVELDPAYCDVIVTRYENLTGRKVR